MEVILTADDFGLTPATSEAILRAGSGGAVTATSVLAPNVTDADLRRAVDVGLAVGVHLALVGEDPPLLSAREIPTLVDGRGRLAASWRHLVPRLAAGRVAPADVRAECHAQIERVAGHVPVAHLDSHQHLHLWPSVAATVVDLAVEAGTPRVRVPRSTGRGPVGVGVTRLADRLQRRVCGAGLAATDAFLGLDEAGRWDLDRLLLAVRALAGQRFSSVEINLHPGAHDDPDRSRYRWDYRWAAELDALVDPRLADAMTAAGLVPVGALADRNGHRPETPGS